MRIVTVLGVNGFAGKGYWGEFDSRFPSDLEPDKAGYRALENMKTWIELLAEEISNRLPADEQTRDWAKRTAIETVRAFITEISKQVCSSEDGDRILMSDIVDLFMPKA